MMTHISSLYMMIKTQSTSYEMSLLVASGGTPSTNAHCPEQGMPRAQAAQRKTAKSLGKHHDSTEPRRIGTLYEEGQTNKTGIPTGRAQGRTESYQHFTTENMLRSFSRLWTAVTE
tara:strand:+ start:240 stop:587 length:348 start_codon:yes stop_codon:yes gene_type:complete